MVLHAQDQQDRQTSVLCLENQRLVQTSDQWELCKVQYYDKNVVFIFTSSIDLHMGVKPSTICHTFFQFVQLFVQCYSRHSRQVLCYSRQVFFYSRQVFLCYSRQVMYAVVESGIMLQSSGIILEPSIIIVLCYSRQVLYAVVVKYYAIVVKYYASRQVLYSSRQVQSSSIMLQSLQL